MLMIVASSNNTNSARKKTQKRLKPTSQNRLQKVVQNGQMPIMGR